ncbi:hypothetical protein H9W91_03845 [Streptomyces alfalfae]|uniref:hypothetical protein n=1 Tax=Streptomyces alfalfae TaxID=1642299 RepID=UPI001BAD8AA7|nr:hypothetical protein [Streptomyces alfalfae]QUI30083.1 hypothetical protein H9W91_03845 [Streptomyces alfalfae]
MGAAVTRAGAGRGDRMMWWLVRRRNEQGGAARQKGPGRQRRGRPGRVRPVSGTLSRAELSTRWALGAQVFGAQACGPRRIPVGMAEMAGVAEMAEPVGGGTVAWTL